VREGRELASMVTQRKGTGNRWHGDKLLNEEGSVQERAWKGTKGTKGTRGGTDGVRRGHRRATAIDGLRETCCIGKVRVFLCAQRRPSKPILHGDRKDTTDHQLLQDTDFIIAAAVRWCELQEFVSTCQLLDSLSLRSLRIHTVLFSQPRPSASISRAGAQRS